MRRSRRLILAAAVALVLTMTALTYRLFVWPQTDPPRRVDAVVVFAGGNGERQAEGARLVRDGVAPVLVISDGGRPGSSKYRLCQQPEGLSVMCFTPQGDSSRSEARQFADLARGEGWRSIALVTSTIHVRRASLLLERCFDGEVFTVATSLRNSSPLEMPRQVLHEWGGLAEALTLARGC